MEIVIAWFFFSILVGAVASSRGQSGFGWFVLSMLLSPLISILALLCTTNLKAETVRKTQHEELLQALRAANPNVVDVTHKEITPPRSWMGATDHA